MHSTAHTTHSHAQVKVQHMLDLLVLIHQLASAFGAYANLNSKAVQFCKFSTIIYSKNTVCNITLVQSS